MLDLRENMIVIDGEIKTFSVERCWSASSSYRRNVIFKNNPKTYSYSYDKVLWLTNPEILDPRNCLLLHNGRRLYPLSYIAAFQNGYQTYWYVEYYNGAYACYKGSEIEFIQSCLEDNCVKNVLEYLRDVATTNPLKADDGTLLLLKQYENIDYIHDCSAAASYLNPRKFSDKHLLSSQLIYPFGCNASQQKAIQAAFEHQISIIQGPPGTGKTQTILNIVANIICQGKTVMIVSNNNSAIENVIEKLDSYKLGFIAAQLGGSENKSKFLESQTTEKAIPKEVLLWRSEKSNTSMLNAVKDQSTALQKVFKLQERLACAKQELAALEIEKTHFEQETSITPDFKIRKQLSSLKLLDLWCQLQTEGEYKSHGIFAKYIEQIRWTLYKLRLKNIFTGIGLDFKKNNFFDLIPIIQRYFYDTKYLELSREIDTIQKTLAATDAKGLMAQLSETSLCYLRSIIYRRFGKGHERHVFQLFTPDFIKEYPIVLSTTFSARGNFKSDALFDYVIMDEASQISAETGALALMCAKNAVIVGDSMQLPNVITDEIRLKLQNIGNAHAIDPDYDCSKLNFLESVCRVFSDAPQTLLREHYRCHPKIINFCNQKFYGGKLIIMTEDNGEIDVLKAWRTVPGNHSRGKFNPREIEVITREVMPAISPEKSKIGVIAPYNEQVNAINAHLKSNVDVATVHKFQGREKDAIIMSVTDDTINSFSDDPNLLNVAVSRAKHQFCLVVSGNDQPNSRNISDLLAYITYNNCTIVNSKICSVFDFLYEQYEDARKDFLKRHNRISEYDSENITFALLENIIEGNQSFSNLGIICHQPLRQLIRERSLLSNDERQYVSNGGTHIDFLIYNRVSKHPVLAIETDGYQFHKQGTKQAVRDDMKNNILSKYNIPLLRLTTIGTDEEARIKKELSLILNLSE